MRLILLLSGTHRRTKLQLLIALLLFATVLSACTIPTGYLAEGYVADKNVTISDGSDKAVIVAGIRNSASRLICVTLYWQRYDIENETFTSQSTEFYYTPGYLKDTIHMVRCRRPPSEDLVGFSNVKYFVYVVKPGKYILSKYKAHWNRKSIPFVNHNFKNTSITFDVIKGEILYIGNFAINELDIYENSNLVTENKFYALSPIKFELDGRDDAAARAVLTKEYLNLTGPVTVRIPEQFLFNSP